MMKSLPSNKKRLKRRDSKLRESLSNRLPRTNKLLQDKLLSIKLPKTEKIARENSLKPRPRKLRLREMLLTSRRPLLKLLRRRDSTTRRKKRKLPSSERRRSKKERQNRPNNLLSDLSNSKELRKSWQRWNKS